MSRRLRVEYGGAIYHVINRGDRREEIFRDARDRCRFLALRLKPDYAEAQNGLERLRTGH